MASLKRRGPVYYIQFYVGTQQRRLSTETGSFQIAKEKLRQFESAEARGDSSLPSKTPIANVLTAYVTHKLVAPALPRQVAIEGRRGDVVFSKPRRKTLGPG